MGHNIKPGVTGISTREFSITQKEKATSGGKGTDQGTINGYLNYVIKCSRHHSILKWRTIQWGKDCLENEKTGYRRVQAHTRQRRTALLLLPRSTVLKTITLD
jgi:hypothetical protein